MFNHPLSLSLIHIDRGEFGRVFVVGGGCVCLKNLVSFCLKQNSFVSRGVSLKESFAALGWKIETKAGKFGSSYLWE